MTVYTAWKSTEVKYLREHYGTDGPVKCAEALGRTYHSVEKKAQRLKLRAPHGSTKAYEHTDFIDAQIRRAYQNPRRGAIAEVSARVGRSCGYVQRRAIQLGLIGPRFKAPSWTEPEIEILRQSNHLAPEGVRDRLKRAGYHRTITAVMTKRKTLGLRQDRAGYSAYELAGLMGVTPAVVNRWIARGMLRAKRSATEKGGVWVITDRAVRDLVIQYTAEVDIRKPDKWWFVGVLTEAHGEKSREMRVEAG